MNQQSKTRILSTIAERQPVHPDALLKPSRCTAGVLAVRLGELRADHLISENKTGLLALTDSGQQLLQRDQRRASEQQPSERPTLRALLIAIDSNPPLTFRPLADAMGIGANHPQRQRLQSLISKASTKRLIDRGFDLRYSLTDAGAAYLEGNPAASTRPDKKPPAAPESTPATIIVKGQLNAETAITDGLQAAAGKQAARRKAKKNTAPAAPPMLPDNTIAAALIKITDQAVRALSVSMTGDSKKRFNTTNTTALIHLSRQLDELARYHAKTEA